MFPIVVHFKAETVLSSDDSFYTNEPQHEKNQQGGFWPGLTQPGCTATGDG